MIPKPWKSVFGLAVFLFISNPGLAVPITYTYEGIGSGTFDGSAFSFAPFTFAALAYTESVFLQIPGELRNLHIATTVDIDGFGDYSVTDATETYLAEGQSGGLIGPNGNWITINEPEIVSVGYQLDTDFSPVLEASVVGGDEGKEIRPTGGTLVFSSFDQVVFSATTLVPFDLCDFDGNGQCDIGDLNAMLTVGPVARCFCSTQPAV